jgi:hypothetical protein
MANTYTLISSVTVGAGGASSIDFTSIPATYTDLKLVYSARTNRATTIDAFYLRFNGETNDTNNSNRYLEGNGTSASSATNLANILTTAASATANTFANYEIYIPNYTGSNQKSVSIDGVTENNEATIYADLIAYKWTGTAAITQISLIAQTGTLVQYTTAYLYGIKNS